MDGSVTQLATYGFEVEVDVSGTYVGAETDVGLGEGYEDLSVDGLWGLKHVRFSKPSQWTRFDLLAGLDARARAIVLANIEAHVGHDSIMEALAAEANDPDADRADYLRDLQIDEDARRAGYA